MRKGKTILAGILVVVNLLPLFSCNDELFVQAGAFELQRLEGQIGYRVVRILDYSSPKLVVPRSYKGIPVTQIGEDAFRVAHGEVVESVVIPTSVKFIGRVAFPNNMGTTIYCEAKSKPTEWDSTWNISLPVVWDYKNNEVANDGYIYKIADGIRYALKDSFAKVVQQPYHLTSVSLPEKVTHKNREYTVNEIGTLSFVHRQFTSVTIPYTVTVIRKKAFFGCSGTGIVIPNSVTVMEEAFDECENLTIYCEAESKPDGWQENWNGGCSVVWGYTQE